MVGVVGAISVDHEPSFIEEGGVIVLKCIDVGITDAFQ
jgi:hypothetical protein